MPTISTKWFFEHDGTRLSKTIRTSLLWGIFAGTATAIWSLPITRSMIEDQGIIIWLCRGITTSFIPMMILALSIRSSADNGTELAQHPARFFLVLAIGATLATVAMWWLDTIFPLRSKFPLAAKLAYWWLNWMVFGSVFGWAGVLNLRRRENQAKLDLLLSRRILLSRQVAQSQLLATRAKIDPKMVVRILNAARMRYHSNPEQAGTLLDMLIGYLRLAMHRVRESQPSIKSELALVRAYLTLRQVEAGIKIELQSDWKHAASEPTPPVLPPIFLIVRHLVNEAVLAHASSITMRIDKPNGFMLIALDIENAFIPQEAITHLRSQLHEMSGGTTELDILHQSPDPGINRYVVTAQLH
jgi:hypothetical protein